ncbi:MAG TPA: FAD-dependent oxidoreductase [Kineosporiaceae bacterium]|nr:FAD-dependent oxidoreductase [Kineosporiaceae bacterium]
MPFASTPTASARASLREASPVPFWLDAPDRPEPRPGLVGAESADLAIVGAGYTGLWTALLAKQIDPDRDVVVLEGETAGHAASGRNGGFCSASLTHGLANGEARFAAELPTLLDLGARNLDQIEATIAQFGIDCGFERTGEIDVATEEHQVGELAEYAELARRYGQEVGWLDRDQLRAEVVSPRYLAGVSEPHGTALVDPARLAWGLREACLQLGVRLYERTPVLALSTDPAGVRLRTSYGGVRAARVALAGNAYPPLLRRIRHYVVPVYDYAVVTEPLTPQQRAEIGWAGRQGLADAGNQFHYYRLTTDRRTGEDRILFGGYDAIYYRGNGFGPQLDQRPATSALLATHLVETFPQLEGIRISHTWGGAIDTCSRFSPFWGTAHAGRVAYVAGYTGLGVGATRFGAAVMLDLLEGLDTERTRLDMVRSRPLPFPPEPVRGIGIDLTRWSLDRADRTGGHRNLWLRALDRLGLGFNS